MNTDTEASTQRPTSGDSGGVATVVTEPLLRVITSNTTPEEVAAIVAVLSSMGRTGAPEALPRSVWASPARKVRIPMAHGRGGWRMSGLPHN
ncbi:MAG TPA: acyl-CoA carboxylase subunit epsilon [Marmoricola sp.]|nr:acyl-CoA carboxylase subunit epsilon [Marmoricola sp.]